jgi:hypothetical protein
MTSIDPRHVQAVRALARALESSEAPPPCLGWDPQWLSSRGPCQGRRPLPIASGERTPWMRSVAVVGEVGLESPRVTIDDRDRWE